MICCPSFLPYFSPKMLTVFIDGVVSRLSLGAVFPFVVPSFLTRRSFPSHKSPISVPPCFFFSFLPCCAVFPPFAFPFSLAVPLPTLPPVLRLVWSYFPLPKRVLVLPQPPARPELFCLVWTLPLFVRSRPWPEPLFQHGFFLMKTGHSSFSVHGYVSPFPSSSFECVDATPPPPCFQL